MFDGLFSGLLGLIGGHQDRIARQDAADEQRRAEQQFNQMGIQWAAADAKAAGFHPSVALGARAGAAPSPVQVGDNFSESLRGFDGLGQDLSRAVSASFSKEQRLAEAAKQAQQDALQTQFSKAQLDGQLIDNQLRQRQLDQLSIGKPGMPGVQSVANPITMSDPSIPGVDPGVINTTGWQRSGDSWSLLPSRDGKERTEDNTFLEAEWAVKNKILPFLGLNTPKPPTGAVEEAKRRGKRLHWDGLEYRLVDGPRRSK